MPYLIRFVRWLTSQVGGIRLLQICILSMIMIAAAYSIFHVDRHISPLSLTGLGVGGLLWGQFINRINKNYSIKIIISLLVGMITVIVTIGDLFLPVIQFLSVFIHPKLGLLPPQPDWSAIAEAWQPVQGKFVILFQHSVTWINSLITGQGNYDLLASMLFWGVMMWLTGLWAGWAILLPLPPLWSLLPVGILQAIILNYSRSRLDSYAVTIGGLIAILLITEFWQRERYWQENNLDYSEELWLDAALIGSFLAITIFVLAWSVPSVNIRPFTQWLYELRHPDLTQENALADSLGLRSGIRDSQSGRSMFEPGLPREHLIGSGPELSERIVLEIHTGDIPPINNETNDFPPVPTYYWRSYVYDEYTGSGWRTSSIEVIDHPANTKLDPIMPVTDSEIITHTIASRIGTLQALYSPGEFLQLDQSSQILFRPVSMTNEIVDIFGIEVNAPSYQVVAQIKNPDPLALESSPPFEISPQDFAHYLSLSDGIPQRVIQLSQEITADLENPFNKAQAIETYLRQYPYTLDLPAPPQDGDIVDYFLFEQRQGYCDYFASAMVVLARAAGLPARLVIGYAHGTYQYENSTYLISAADAHSWPEVYIYPWGWIIFEPTAGLPAINRSPTQPASGELSDSIPSNSHSNPFNTIFTHLTTEFPWAIGIIFTGIMVALFLWYAPILELKLLSDEQLMPAMYRKLQEHALRSQIDIPIDVTPLEFFSSYYRHIQTRRADSGDQAPGAISARLIFKIISEYNLQCYAQAPDVKKKRAELILLWRRLRWFLWLDKWQNIQIRAKNVL